MNELTKLLELFPKPELWHWQYLTMNPNITLEYIDSHPEFPWISEFESKNPNLTLEYIMTHPDKEWKWNYVLSNPGITLQNIEYILEYLIQEPTPYNWENVSMNPNITLDFILKNINNFDTISKCKNLGDSKNITLENIKQYPNLFWNTMILAKNPNLTLEFVNDNLQLFKSFLQEIGRNPNITFQDALKYPKFITCLEFMRGLSQNPNITIDIIRENPTLDWRPIFMMENPSLAIEDLLTYIDNDEYIGQITENPNITVDYVINNIDKLRFGYLSKNPFGYHPHFSKKIVIKM